MPSVLTMLSTVTCGHTLPGKPGKVQTQSQAKLKVNGSPVLLQTSINGKPVAECGISEATGYAPCRNVLAVSAGAALKLKVSTDPVMLDTLQGSTDGMLAGAPQTLLAGVANQSKLQAV
jgi:hypothetical protein